MTILTQRADDLLLRGAVSAHQALYTGLDRFTGALRRRYAESRVAWFAIVIAVVIFLGLALAAYLTVQCWNRGYSGFTGQVYWEFTDWRHINVRVHFACV